MKTLENDDIILIMDYYKVDVLTAGQLMVDDNILVDDEVVCITEIVSLADGYTLEIINDFGERDTIEVTEYQQFDLMMLK
jgi:hypothetical protein